MCAAVAGESLAILVEEDIPGHARQTSSLLQSELAKLRGKQQVLDVRGHEFLAAMDSEPIDGRGYGAFDQAIVDATARRGVLVRAVGDTVMLCPPLVSTETEMMAMASRLL